MKLFILSLLLASTNADNHCKGIYFKDNYYNVEVIREGISRIHQIAYRPSDNTLYFTFDQIAKIPTRALGYLNLNTYEAGLVDGIQNATGLAIDKAKNRIYVGGSNGLYFLNDRNVPQKLPTSQNIRYLFFKNIVYFINYRGEVFAFEDGTVNNVKELLDATADEFIIDDNDNMLFLKNNQLFRVKMGTKAINIHENYVVTTIATDKSYKPYICTDKGLYTYNKYKYALDKVADSIIGARAITFTNNDEPIYMVVDNVVKLTYNPVPCFGD